MNTPRFRLPVVPPKTTAAGEDPGASAEKIAQFAAGAAMVISQAAPSAPSAQAAAAPTVAVPTTLLPHQAIPARPEKPCRLNVDLDPQIHTRLRHLAVARRTTVSAVIRIAILRELG